MPQVYGFNIEVGVDVLEVKDSEGSQYLMLNIVCTGTGFQQVESSKWCLSDPAWASPRAESAWTHS
jgi:hypothetical protein